MGEDRGVKENRGRVGGREEEINVSLFKPNTCPRAQTSLCGVVVPCCQTSQGTTTPHKV